jgi:hypothetical protein
MWNSDVGLGGTPSGVLSPFTHPPIIVPQCVPTHIDGPPHIILPLSTIDMTSIVAMTSIVNTMSIIITHATETAKIKLEHALIFVFAPHRPRWQHGHHTTIRCCQ